MGDRENFRRHRSEEMPLESAVWTGELGAYEWDVTTDHVRWLNRWCEHYDIDPCEGECHGERWRALVHPDDRAQARREFDEHMAGRRARYETEYRIQTLSGSWRWIRNRGYVIRSPDGREERVVGVCVDVDERKRTELALGRTQRKLEALAAAAPTWMMLTDAEGVIEFVNRPMHCIASGAMTGRNIASLFPDPAEGVRVDEFRKALVEGRGAPQMHTMILEDGRALATWARPIIEGGHVVGIASVTADVSERQDREREVLAAINREQRRFGRDLHDGLGQELTGIALLVRSLSSRAGKEAPELVEGLEEVLRHVTTAIATTRTVARGVSPVGREQGGLAYALQALARRWRETHDANVQCHVDVSDPRELEPMLADNFYHIAQEALTNAMMHSGATHVVMELRQSPRRLSLMVTDDGCGIPPAADRGDGLGLKIMRGRAELVGAQLTVEACNGSGTRLDCLYKWPRAGDNARRR